MCKEPEIDPKDPFGEKEMLSVNTNSNVVDIFYNGEWRYTGVLIATMSPEGCFDGESPHWLVLSRTGETVMIPYGDEQWNLVFMHDEDTKPLAIVRREISFVFRQFFTPLRGILTGFFGSSILWGIFIAICL